MFNIDRFIVANEANIITFTIYVFIDAASISFIVITSKLFSDLTLNLTNHSICNFQNLVKITQVGQRALSFFHQNILFLDEFFLLCHIILDVF
jgi:hypothetical protein